MLCGRYRAMRCGDRPWQSSCVQSLRAPAHRERPGFPVFMLHIFINSAGFPGQHDDRRRSPSEAPKSRDVELVLGLGPGTGNVQRPRRPDAGLAGLDEFRDGDVDDALAAGLGAGDAEQAVDLAAGTLACGPRELVAEEGVDGVDESAWCQARLLLADQNRRARPFLPSSGHYCPVRTVSFPGVSWPCGRSDRPAPGWGPVRCCGASRGRAGSWLALRRCTYRRTGRQESGAV